MPEPIRNIWRLTTVHRIAIAFLVLFSINSLCSSVIAALSGMDWAASTTQVKVQVITGIVGNWTAVLLAFFRDALAKLFRGESPLTTLTSGTSGPYAPMTDTERFAKLPDPKQPGV